jgi:hypothetical protein
VGPGLVKDYRSVTHADKRVANQQQGSGCSRASSAVLGLHCAAMIKDSSFYGFRVLDRHG